MPAPKWIKNYVQPGVEGFINTWPRNTPPREKVRNCKIISHRGEHDNKTVYENTLAAFDRAQESGVWGIEMDIRWTRDLIPVVFHDEDCMRVFDSPSTLRSMTLEELNNAFPLIPTLETVIKRYGKKLHLMVEIKQDDYDDTELWNRILDRLFSQLTAEDDFHILSLDPALFQTINFAPRSSRLLIAETNVKTLSNIALKESFGGITGHYFLINNALLKRHHNRSQKIGTGFPSSKNCLYREINRNVEWVFSDNAAELQSIYDRLLGK